MMCPLRVVTHAYLVATTDTTHQLGKRDDTLPRDSAAAARFVCWGRDAPAPCQTRMSSRARGRRGGSSMLP